MATTGTRRRQGRRHEVPGQEGRRTRGLVAASALSGALVSATVLAIAAAPVTAGAAVKTIQVSTANVQNVGTVLTTGAGLTLYRFTKDPNGMATCTGTCAKIWPPFLTAKGAHIKGPKGVKGLSLINVGGGHWQVAFHHVALYRFEGDTKKGQAKGQGVANAFYAVLKSGIPAVSTPAATPAAPAATTTTQAPNTATTAPPAQQTPVTQPPPPPTTRPTSPPTTTTSPPTTTTPTTTGGSGGVGF
jgi:predicted lipoprotein with Yx(FWY)xxD motif